MDMTSGSSLDLATLLQNSVKNADGDNNLWGGNGFLILFLLLLFGWGNNGFLGNRNGSPNDENSAISAAIERARADGLSDQVIVDAVKGNASAIQSLSATFGADIGAVQSALNTISNGISTLGGQINLNGQQVINAIQMGNQTLGQQLMECCCENKALLLEQSNINQMAIMNQTNTLSDRIRTGFSDIHSLIDQQNVQMSAGFQSIKDMFTQNKIDSLQAEITQLRNDATNTAQTTYLQNYVTSQTAPLQTAINTLLVRSTPAPVPAYLVNSTNGCGCTGA
jgi:hypothetical protein